MKIYYITNARIPTEKAHGLQIVKTCEALNKLGVDVELVLPVRKNKIDGGLFDYYGVDHKFKVRRVSSFDWFRLYQLIGASVAFKLQSLFFVFKLRKINISREATIYTRSAEIAWLFGKKGYRVFYEAHVWPKSKIKLFKKMLGCVEGIITNSKGTADKFRQNGFKNILVAPNGVDLKLFEIRNKKLEIREELKLPLDKKIVMYVGHLYAWKGVDLLIEAADKLRQKNDLIFALVGGISADIKKYQEIVLQKGLKNVLILGHKPSCKIPQYLCAADILLLPNLAITEESKYYTSPIKMFEYMASGTPIVAADLMSIKEVLNNENAVLFKAGNSLDMVEKIDLILQNSDLKDKIAAQALEDVKGFSWDKRAEKILAFIK